MRSWWWRKRVLRGARRHNQHIARILLVTTFVIHHEYCWIRLFITSIGVFRGLRKILRFREEATATNGVILLELQCSFAFPLQIIHQPALWLLISARLACNGNILCSITQCVLIHGCCCAFWLMSVAQCCLT